MAQPPVPRRRQHATMDSLRWLLVAISWTSAYPEQVSLVLWVVAVAAFARWAQTHPALMRGTPWVGMTVATALYAVLTLTMREWFVLRWTQRHTE